MTYQPYAWPRTDKGSAAAAVRAHKDAKTAARAHRRTVRVQRIRQHGRVAVQKVKGIGFRRVFLVLPFLCLAVEAVGLYVEYVYLPQ